MRIRGKHIFDLVPTVEGLGNLALAVDVSGKAPLVHTHAIADVVNLQNTLNNKAALSHTHVIGDVFLLQTTLDGKANTTHTHVISDVTGLQTALNGKANTIHSHVISDVTGLQIALDGKAALSHSHAISDVTGLQTTLNGKQPINTLGNKSLSSLAQTPTITEDGYVYYYDSTTGLIGVKSVLNDVIDQPSDVIDTNSGLNVLNVNSKERQIYIGSTFGKQTSLGNATTYKNIGRTFKLINTTQETISILYNDNTDAFRLEPYCSSDVFLVDKTTTNGTWYFTIEYPDWVLKSDDDYISSSTAGQSNNTVTVTGTAAAISQASGVAGSQGVITLDVGTTATGVATYSNTATLLNLGTSNGVTILERRVQIPTLSAGGQAFSLLVGLGDTTATGDHVDGIYFLHDNTSLNWMFRARSNSVSTPTTTTLVPIVASQWYKLKIELNHNNTSCSFYIDDVSVGSISSGLPNTAGRQLSPNIKIYKTNGTQSRTVNEDYRKFRNYLKR